MRTPSIAAGFVTRRICTRVAGLLMLASLSAALGAADAASAPRLVQPEEIEALVKASPGRVVVQFTASDPECGPCIRANATYEALAASPSRRGDFLRVSTARWGDWAKLPLGQRLKIPAVPAIIVFEGGEEKLRLLGDRPRQFLEKDLLSPP